MAEAETIPMEVDGGEGREAPPQETQEECNKRICVTLIPHIFAYQSQLKGVLVNRMRDVDMWAGTVDVRPFGFIRTFMVEHTLNFRLCDGAGVYTIAPGIVPCKTGNKPLPEKPPINSDTNQPFLYATEAVYPFTLSVKRWDNRTPLDIGLYANGKPAGLERPELAQVMRNWGEQEAMFMVMKAGSTQETYQDKSRTAPEGLAYVGRDFGPVSQRHLSTFAPIRREHLRNGCVPIPDDVMQAAHLPFTDVEGDLHIRRWFLLPIDSLLAWPIRKLSYEERITQFGVVAIGPISAHDKRADRIIETYLVITDKSLDLLVEGVCDKVVDKIAPFDLGKIGVRAMPCECPGEPSWTDLTANTEIVPGMTQEDHARVMQAPRSLFVRYYVKYAIFPQGMEHWPNLAARVPDDWPEYVEFDGGGAPAISAVATPDQRQKK
jgi:hypothetical protein